MKILLRAVWVAKVFCHSVEGRIKEPQNESFRDLFCKNMQEHSVHSGRDSKVQYVSLELRKDY